MAMVLSVSSVTSNTAEQLRRPGPLLQVASASSALSAGHFHNAHLGTPRNGAAGEELGRAVFRSYSDSDISAVLGKDLADVPMLTQDEMAQTRRRNGQRAAARVLKQAAADGKPRGMCVAYTRPGTRAPSSFPCLPPPPCSVPAATPRAAPGPAHLDPILTAPCLVRGLCREWPRI